jgi:hypothetical protein
MKAVIKRSMLKRSCSNHKRNRNQIRNDGYAKEELSVDKFAKRSAITAGQVHSSGRRRIIFPVRRYPF